MSSFDHGPLSTYNSLTDEHLAGYFSNARLQRHLQRSGLITKNGVIVSENTYRLNMSRKEHKKQIKDMLAQAIVHKSLDLERARQAEIRRVLEQIAKIQIVRRVRESRAKSRSREGLPGLTGSRPSSSPHAYSGSSHSHKDGSRAHSEKGKRSRSARSANYEDEFIVYLDDDGTPLSPQHLEGVSDKYSSRDDTRHLAPLDTASLQKYMRLLAQVEQGRGGTMSPYLIPQVPLPPRSPRSGNNYTRSSHYRSSQKNSKSASPKGQERKIHRCGSPKRSQGKQATQCEVHMLYHGINLSLAREGLDKRQDVLVEQQHSGGGVLKVFSAKLEPETKFSFVSHHYRGYPFSLTFYIDGKMDCRLSTCCEYRHHQGARIGGKAGHFSITKIVGAVPCYKCQVERTLGKKNQRPQSNHKQSTEDHEEVTVVRPISSSSSSAKKKPNKKVPEAKKEKLVPVDNIDDKNGDDNYDDDFEASSSSSSSNEEEAVTSDTGNDRKRRSYPKKRLKDFAYYKRSKDQNSRTSRTGCSVSPSYRSSYRSGYRPKRSGSGYRSQSPADERDTEALSYMSVQKKMKKIARNGNERKLSKPYRIPVTVDVEESDEPEQAREVSLNVVLKVHSSRGSQEVEMRDVQRQAEIQVNGNHTPRHSNKNILPELKTEEEMTLKESMKANEAMNLRTHKEPNNLKTHKKSMKANDPENLRTYKEPMKAKTDSRSSEQKTEDPLKSTSSVSFSSSYSSHSSSVSRSSSSSTLTQTSFEREESKISEKKVSDGLKVPDYQPQGLKNMKYQQKDLEDMKMEETDSVNMKNKAKDLEIIENDAKELDDHKGEAIELEIMKDKAKKLENMKDERKDLEYTEDETKDLEDHKNEAVELEDTKDKARDFENLKDEENDLEYMKNEAKDSKDSKYLENGKDSEYMKNEAKDLEYMKNDGKGLKDIEDDAKNVSFMKNNANDLGDMKDETENLEDLADKPTKGEHEHEVTVDEGHEIVDERNKMETFVPSNSEESEDDKEMKQETQVILETKADGIHFQEGNKNGLSSGSTTSLSSSASSSTSSSSGTASFSSQKLKILDGGLTAPTDSAQPSSGGFDAAPMMDKIANQPIISNGSVSKNIDKDSQERDFDKNQQKEDFDKDQLKGDFDKDQLKGDFDKDQLKGDFKKDQLKGDFDKDQLKGDFDKDQLKGDFNKDQLKGDFDKDQLKGDFDKNHLKVDFEKDQQKGDFDIEPVTAALNIDQSSPTVTEEFKRVVTAKEHSTQQISENIEVQTHIVEDTSSADKIVTEREQVSIADLGDAETKPSSDFDEQTLSVVHAGNTAAIVREKSRTVLELKDCKLDENKLEDLFQQMKNEEEIKDLSITNCDIDDNSFKRIMHALGESPSKPVVVNFSDNSLTSDCVEMVLDILEKKPSIEAVMLGDNRLGDTGVKQLVDGILKLHKEKTRDDHEGGQEEDRHSNGPQELDLHKCSFGDTGATSLAQLITSDVDIDTLNLSSNTDVTTSGWKVIGEALEVNKSLETLTLDYNAIGDEGIEVISKSLYNNRSISTLDLNSVGMNEKGGEHLMNLLKRNVTIIEMNLKGNNISDQLIGDIQKYIALNKSMAEPEKTQQD